MSSPAKEKERKFLSEFSEFCKECETAESKIIEQISEILITAPILTSERLKELCEKSINEAVNKLHFLSMSGGQR